MLRVLANNVYDFDIFLCKKLALITGKRFLDRLMRWISRSGDGHLYAVSGIVALLVDRGSGAAFFLAGVAAFIVEICIQKAVKHMAKRERPDSRVTGLRRLLEPPDRFSFPSGHTAGAVLVVTLLNYFYPLNAVALYSWAVMVGFSRVYNGVHYPTDVLTGGVLGLVSAWIGIGIVL